MSSHGVSGEIVLTNFGLKFEPAKLGIQYHFKENKKASFVHEISLSNISKGSKAEEVARELFKSNPTFLNPDKVSPKQIENLIKKLLERKYGIEEDKENKVNHASKEEEEPEEKNEDDDDVIDIDNEEELAKRGLKKIQIEGENEEFLMDAEGNIYNLNGDFIGATNEGEGEDDDGF